MPVEFTPLDEIEAEALADWEEYMAPVIDPLRDLVARSESFDELVEGLAELLGEMDVDALARTLGGALFLAKGAGDAGGE